MFSNATKERESLVCNYTRTNTGLYRAFDPGRYFVKTSSCRTIIFKKTPTTGSINYFLTPRAVDNVTQCFWLVRNVAPIF